MADVVYVGVIVGFFALTALFVRGCDRIIGPDDAVVDPGAESERVGA